MIRLTRLWAGQRRGVLNFGIWVGVSLALLLASLLLNERDLRIHAAQRQSLLLVRAVERLLAAELRSQERALRSIADDVVQMYPQMPGQVSAPLARRLRAVSARNPELESIVLVDARGQALSPGRGDPTLPHWTLPGGRGDPRALRIGSPQPLPDGDWALPLALRMAPQRWLLARLRLSELRRIVSGLAPGNDGLLMVVGGDGSVLTRTPGPTVVGQRRPLPLSGMTVAHQPIALGTRSGDGDQRARIAAAIVVRDYPLQVYAAIDRRQILRSWWLFLGGGCLILVIYAMGLAYLLRSLRRAEHRRRRLIAELRAGDAELRLAYQAGGTGTWWIEAQGTHLCCSPLTAQMLDLPADRLPLADLFRRLHREERGRVRQALTLAWRQGRAFALTFRLCAAHGRQRWLAVRGALIEQSGDGRRLTGTVVDISERIENQTLALDAQRQFRMIFELNPLPCWLCEVNTLEFIEVNPAAVHQYGYSREQFLSMRITDIRPPEYAEQTLQRLRRPVTTAATTSLFTVHRRKDGTLLDVRVHWSHLSIGGSLVALVLAENVTDHLAYQRELAFRVNHDADTGLLTVRALAERLRERGAQRYTVVHVQVRGLQLIADTLGRAVGDEVLRRLCARLQRLADGCDGELAFQPSQDFVLMIGCDRDPDAVIHALEVLMSEPVRGRDSLHPLEVRIGVAQFPRDAASAEEAFAKAALAAREARQADVVVKRFDEGISRRLSERLHLIGRLHEAVHRGEFELHYQPVVDSDAAGPVVLEALLRWRMPGRGLVPPSEFVPLCEDTGLILPLGRWALEQAARDRRRLLDAGWTRLSIAVNVSALQFLSTDVAADVAQVCGAQGLEPGMLSVELTETTLVRNPEQARQAMQRLHSQGVSIALDDFGTGFSNMSYLQEMPLDSLKIDRTFVDDVDSDARNAAICRALITLGHSLGLKVVAEGVERAAQRAWLVANGCEHMQGYLIARPAPLDDVLDWLKARA